jgi:N6-adenosine-specific RNA methylase IME4
MKRKAPGILPSKSWLQANGYNRLYQAMKAHPERFAHIQREHKRNTPGEWVSVAERLARKCGKLPSRGWLLANGCDGLYQAMWAHPERFAHIQRERKYHTPDEWVSVAERLARKHGRLPSPGSLQAYGYRGLYDAMRAHPKRFAHIQQEHKLRTPDEWVSVAERLARKHGKLPSPGWLQANGYNWLYRAMWAHPEKCAHIQREHCRNRRLLK